MVDTAGALVLPSLQKDQPTLFGHPVLATAALPARAANAKSVIVGAGGSATRSTWCVA